VQRQRRAQVPRPSRRLFHTAPSTSQAAEARPPVALPSQPVGRAAAEAVGAAGAHGPHSSRNGPPRAVGRGAPRVTDVYGARARAGCNVAGPPAPQGHRGRYSYYLHIIPAWCAAREFVGNHLRARPVKGPRRGPARASRLCSPLGTPLDPYTVMHTARPARYRGAWRAIRATHSSDLVAPGPTRGGGGRFRRPPHAPSHAHGPVLGQRERAAALGVLLVQPNEMLVAYTFGHFSLTQALLAMPQQPQPPVGLSAHCRPRTRSDARAAAPRRATPPWPPVP